MERLKLFQCYSVNCVRFTEFDSTAFPLLPDKIELMYSHFFDQLKLFEPTLVPRTILTDFEPATIKGVKNEYP